MDNINDFLLQSTKEKFNYDETIQSITELGMLAGV
jgi:hypothetical protein